MFLYGLLINHLCVSCDWGTGRVTVCPPGPEATRRLSLAGAVEGQDETSQSGHRGACGGDEDVTLSPSVALQRVYVEDDMEVVIRSPRQRHARAGEHERVTQLAAHSISDGKRSGELHHQGFTEQRGDFCEEDAGAVAHVTAAVLASWGRYRQRPDDGRPSYL